MKIDSRVGHFVKVLFSGLSNAPFSGHPSRQFADVEQIQRQRDVSEGLRRSEVHAFSGNFGLARGNPSKNRIMNIWSLQFGCEHNRRNCIGRRKPIRWRGRWSLRFAAHESEEIGIRRNVSVALTENLGSFKSSRLVADPFQATAESLTA